MNACAACMHWRRDPEAGWDFDRANFGKCLRIKHREDVVDRRTYWTEWQDDPSATPDAEDQRLIDLIAATRAVVVDGSGYYAALMTAADFGCTLFEPPTEILPPLDIKTDMSG